MGWLDSGGKNDPGKLVEGAGLMAREKQLPPVRCKDEQYQQYKAAAAKKRRTLSDWIRLALDRQAKQDLRGRE